MKKTKLNQVNFGFISTPENGKHKPPKGFTLIEGVILVSFLIIIGTAIWAFQKDILFLNRVFENELDFQREILQTFKTMSAEIRSASPSSLGAYPIAEGHIASFTFYSDIDDDGPKEQIRYFLQGDVLKKGIIKPSGTPLVYNPANEILSDAVENIVNGATPVFEYYDSNYDGQTPPLSQPVNLLDIRLIKVTLLVDHNTSQPPPASLFTTQISMRNLKDNL